MRLAEKLAKERRLRLAAERKPEHKSRELFAANEKLALHARALSNQIVEQRKAVRSALVEAEELKGENSRYLAGLDRAHTAVVMAERRLWDSVEAIQDAASPSSIPPCSSSPQTEPISPSSSAIRRSPRHRL